MDIKDAVELLTGFDIVIYGGDTKVFGDETESLRKVLQCSKSKGYLIYETHVKSLKDIAQPIKRNGMQIIDWAVRGREEIININKVNNEKIIIRAQELIEQYPDQKELFENHIRTQKQESLELEYDLMWLLLLLQRTW